MSIKDPSSPEFLDFLRSEGKVISEDKNWLVVEDLIRSKPDRPWHTAYHKHGMMSMRFLSSRYWEWEWLKPAKKPDGKPQRFHIHFYKV